MVILGHPVYTEWREVEWSGIAPSWSGEVWGGTERVMHHINDDTNRDLYKFERVLSAAPIKFYVIKRR